MTLNTELMFSSAGDLWRTPKPFVAWLNHRFEFTLDAAASDDAIAPEFIDEQQDALVTPWHGRVFVNPPYSMCKEFIARAIEQSKRPKVEGVCLLVPARTDTGWWQDSFENYRKIEFLRGRLKFWMTPDEVIIVNAARARQGKKPLAAENSAPFPSALLMLGFKDRVPESGCWPVECVDWRKDKNEPRRRIHVSSTVWRSDRPISKDQDEGARVS